MKDAPDTPRRFGRPDRDTNLALLAGLVTALGLPPFPWTGILVPVGLAILFTVLVRSPRPGRTAWFFALAHQGALLHWLFLLDPSKSIPTRALVPIQAVATVLYVSVFYLLAGWAFGRLRARLGAARALLLLPVLWTVMEAARGRGEMAFSWCLTGAAVVGTPLMALARAGGELGVGVGFTTLAVVVAARRLGPSHRRTLWAAAAGCAAVWVFLVAGAALEPALPGAEGPARREPLKVAAIQADVALADKWQDARIDSTKIPYAELTREAADAGAEFVVWAETAVPAYLRLDPDLMAWIRGVVREAGVHLYTGFPDADRGPDGEVRRFNSSGLFDPRGVLRDTYAKHHLLPIGEAMPFTRYLPFLAGLDVGQAEWMPGLRPQAMTVARPGGDFPFSGLICFESVFSWLARESVLAGSRCLVVITNDGWFGESAGPRQHAALARLRAAECAVPVVRSANNGISFICDDAGRLVEVLGLGRRGFVLADVTPGTGRTLFVRYGSAPLFGLLLVWTVLVAVVPWLPRRPKGAGR
jgi:apolipoprotein N-acyltransferase